MSIDSICNISQALQQVLCSLLITGYTYILYTQSIGHIIGECLCTFIELLGLDEDSEWWQQDGQNYQANISPCNIAHLLICAKNKSNSRYIN